MWATIDPVNPSSCSDPDGDTGRDTTDASNDATDTATNDTSTSWFQALCEWQVRCDDETDSVDECLAEWAQEFDESRIRPDASSAGASCYQTLACGGSDDLCFGAAAMAVTNDPTTIDEFNTCMSRREACEDDDGCA